MKKLLTILAEKLLLNLPWPEMLAEAWNYSKKVFRGSTCEGMYEVLNLEVTLELLNKKGTRARFSKIKKIRYLQNNTIAFQDYAWGDGEILKNYKSSIGKPVDKYRLGYKTYILLSLGEEKSRGQVDEYKIRWEIKDGFLKNDGFWETDISQKTERVKVNVIFPKSRNPKSARMIESNHHRTIAIPRDDFQVLKDGRIQISWQKKTPRLYEHYLLKWDW